MKKWIVVAIDVGETANGHSTFCGIFNSREEAETYVKEDMTDVLNMGAMDNSNADWVKHEVWQPNCDGTDGCVWDIHEIEV